LLPTGEEGFFVINHDAIKLKEFFAKIEETHPLGRFMDVDVFDDNGVQITREAINEPPRKCLLCDRDARECYLLRSHTPQQLKDFIDSAVIEFNAKENQKTKV
ncbi:MAG: citrate lyase holo-[Clostridia bacterium]|nr:citrate lyase holo-[acyl-carrier protein] synthase [Clostridia bacterium]